MQQRKIGLLIVCASLYHILTALLYLDIHKIDENVYFLLTMHDLSTYDKFLSVREKLSDKGFFASVRFRDRRKELIGLEYIKDFRENREIGRMLSTHNYQLLNFCWNVDAIQRTANYHYKRADEVILFEEGARQTAMPRNSPFILFIKKVYGIAVNFISDDKIKAVYVHEPAGYPREFQDKMVCFDINAWIDRVGESEREDIAKILLSEAEFKQIRQLEHSKFGILFTQPISEDGYVEASEKYDIYKKMYEYYSKYGAVVLKRHLRDTTEYDFADIAVDGKFPSEVFPLLGIKFAFAIGLCTSAVVTANADFKLNLNDNFLNDKQFKLRPIGE